MMLIYGNRGCVPRSPARSERIMTLHSRVVLFAASTWLAASPWAAQAAVPPRGPIVSMQVTGPGGQTRELTTHESGLATLDVNGRQYGFRPTMHDDAGEKMTVTVFDMGAPGQPVRQLAELQVTGGGPSVASKTTPAFLVTARKGARPQGVSAPPHATRK
jgi:hypothetical protein